MWDYVEDRNISIPEDSELVLELTPSSDARSAWSYYFVHHGTRSLFWVHEYDITHATVELLGRPGLPLLRKSIRFLGCSDDLTLALKTTKCSDTIGTSAASIR